MIQDTLQNIAASIDKFSTAIGKAIAWLALAMVVVMFANVLQRYVFNANFVWQQELVRFMHAMLFLLAASYTLLKDGHVRVDIVYHNASERFRAWIDIMGTLIFLWPVCVATVMLSFQFVTDSWQLWEGSPEYLGMPGVFLLKTCIWGFALTLAMQGISTVCRGLIVLGQGGGNG